MKPSHPVPSLLPAALLAASLWASAPAQATTVYTINTTITSSAPTGNPQQTDSVVGTITTDGTIGVLGATNIVDWNLALIDDLNAANDFTLTHSDSLLVESTGLSATESGLFFDFSGSGEFLIQVSPYSGSQYFCFSTGGACSRGETISPAYVYNDGVILTGDDAPVGNQPIGSSPMAPVPEPESYAMMLAGLGVIGSLARRRSLKRAGDLRARDIVRREA